MKQPITIAVSLMTSMNNPYRILLENPSKKLTNLSDCVEAVRYLGVVKTDSLSALETECEPALTDEYIYHLKLKLIVIDAKSSYYQRRSSTYFEILKEQESSMMKVVILVRALLLLERMASRQELSDRAQLSMRCLKIFIEISLKEENPQEPLKSAKEIIESRLNALMGDRKTSNHIAPEVCFYCQEEIDKDRLSCSKDHQQNRCIITKLQIPISMNNRCEYCFCCTIDRQTLQELTGDVEQLCPYCDHQLTFT